MTEYKSWYTALAGRDRKETEKEVRQELEDEGYVLGSKHYEFRQGDHWLVMVGYKPPLVEAAEDE